MQFDASTKPSDFDEAASWFLARVPMTREEWDELSRRAQRRAFTVSGVAEADVLHDVFRSIDRAVATGATLGEFRKAVQERLENAWRGSVSNPAWRAEVIFRNNVQSSYNAGRVNQMRHPDVADVRPYWMFDAILDARVSEICEPLAGTVLPMGHPWWKTRTPPLHHACRSAIRSLRESQARKRGIMTNPPQDKAAAGFGLDPTENEWQPDLNRFPPDLRRYVSQRLNDIEESKPKPPPRQATTEPKAKPVAKPKSEPTPKEPQAQAPKAPTPAPAPKIQPVEQDSSVGNFRSLEEAHTWASRKYPGVQWDFEGAHIDAINPTLKQFDTLHQEWPEAAASIKYVGTYQGKNSPRKLNWDKEEPRAIAMWDSERNHLAINPKFYSNPVEFAKKKKYDESIGWYVTGSKDIASMLSHEFGHVIDTWMLLRPSPLKDQWLAFKAQNATELAKLSMYAAVIPTVEGIAEAFARQHHGGKTKQPVVKKMIALIRAAQKQGGK